MWYINWCHTIKLISFFLPDLHFFHLITYTPKRCSLTRFSSYTVYTREDVVHTWLYVGISFITHGLPTFGYQVQISGTNVIHFASIIRKKKNSTIAILCYRNGERRADSSWVIVCSLRSYRSVIFWMTTNTWIFTTYLLFKCWRWLSSCYAREFRR